MLDAREEVHNPLSDIAIHCAMGYQIIKINVMNVNEFMIWSCALNSIIRGIEMLYQTAPNHGSI